MRFCNPVSFRSVSDLGKVVLDLLLKRHKKTPKI